MIAYHPITGSLSKLSGHQYCSGTVCFVLAFAHVTLESRIMIYSDKEKSKNQRMVQCNKWKCFWIWLNCLACSHCHSIQWVITISLLTERWVYTTRFSIFNVVGIYLLYLQLLQAKTWWIITSSLPRQQTWLPCAPRYILPAITIQIV